ncbi:MurR/RpiR family transcriptional regulator [Polaromonas jejuensis]|uniref:MurR/RpiR family transcriptional regulator n=1 Tax=Polaromonas jejuensis TaxID=457502 RepID=A0ABW0QC69_9BURK|nr:MurR/RpiR family transcriptional regulator [Polaromonas jejuensis]
MKNRISYPNSSLTAGAQQRRYASADVFLATVHAGYDQLSRQLKTIARYVEKNRDRLALDGIQETARHCEVQPSAVVRFAKHFGFSGFSEMQALFRAGAERQLDPNRDYQDRIRDLVGTGAHALSAAHIAHEMIGGSIDSLQALQRSLPDDRFDEAVALMLDAPSLWVMAARRAFPVGAYLVYALQHTNKPVHWLQGLGHMEHGQLRALAKGDVLIAVSFEPYAQETLDVAQAALQRGARLLAITDSQLSPLAAQATTTLLVQDGATFGFRSLTSTLCLAQSLFLGLAYRLELAYEKKTPRK